MSQTIALVTCEDWRLHQRPDGKNLVAEFCCQMHCQVFPVIQAGGVQHLVRPKQAGFREFIFYCLDVAVKNGATRIVNLNHLDCHDYHSSLCGDSEVRQHVYDMEEAALIQKDRYRLVSVVNYLAILVEGSRTDFIIKPADQLRTLVGMAA